MRYCTLASDKDGVLALLLKAIYTARAREIVREVHAVARARDDDVANVDEQRSELRGAETPIACRRLVHNAALDEEPPQFRIRSE